MRKVLVFLMTTLDGYIAGPDDDIDWHTVDEEFNQFAIEQLDSVDTLLFGRKTFEGMASYWPTLFAIESDPEVANRMNTISKIVFSATLDNADVWENSRLIKDHIAEEIGKLKQQPGKDLIIFGSSNLAASMIDLGLIDEFRIMVNPVLIGKGKPLFEGVQNRVKLKLLNTRVFASGNVLHYYGVDQ